MNKKERINRTANSEDISKRQAGVTLAGVCKVSEEII